MHATCPRPWTTSQRRVAATLIALLSFVVYLTNLRQHGAADTLPARLLPFSVLREANVDFDEFSYVMRAGAPGFFFEASNQRSYSIYPITAPLLVTPLAVPAVWWLETRQIPDTDVRFRLTALIVERIGAATIAALSVALLFLAACEITSTRNAAVIALVYGFGTNLWAVGSQALWQHGLAALALAGASLSFLRPSSRRNAIAAGAFAALGVAARPTMLLFAFAALLFVVRHRRTNIVYFLIFPSIVATALLAYNLSIASAVAGGYYRMTYFSLALENLGGILISPSRGLLIYTPAVLLALPTMLRRSTGNDAWLRYSLAGFAGYVLLYGSFPNWWGGHSFGPRFFVDALPALALCAIPTVERLARSTSGRAALLVLAAWGIGVQIIGVYFDDNDWNVRPGAIDSSPDRLWDWSDPQILRAARAGWHGTDLAPLLVQMIAAPVAADLEILPAAALAGDIEIGGLPPLVMPTAADVHLPLRVTNRGTAAWPAFSDFGFLQVNLLYSWWSDNIMLQDVGGLIDLPRNLPVGGVEELTASLRTPTAPGNYELRLTVVQTLSLGAGTPGTTVRIPAVVADS